MSRKSKKPAPLPPEPRPPAAETSKEALQRLAELIGRGSGAMRMEREASALIGRWSAALDPETMRERLDEIREQLAEGVEAAEESAGEIDSDSRGAVAAHQHTLAALRATHSAFARAAQSVPA